MLVNVLDALGDEAQHGDRELVHADAWVGQQALQLSQGAGDLHASPGGYVGGEGQRGACPRLGYCRYDEGEGLLLRAAERLEDRAEDGILCERAHGEQTSVRDILPMPNETAIRVPSRLSLQNCRTVRVRLL